MHLPKLKTAIGINIQAKAFIFLNPNFWWDSSTPYYCWKQTFYYKAETANSSPPEDSDITALYMVMCWDAKVLFMSLLEMDYTVNAGYFSMHTNTFQSDLRKNQMISCMMIFLHIY